MPVRRPPTPGFQLLKNSPTTSTTTTTTATCEMKKINADVLLFVPNIIGYIRILLTVLAFKNYQDSSWFIIFYGTSAILDGLDGYAARKLNQCSDFGAWFDVVVDLLGRGLLWCSLFQYGYLVVFLEWMTFVATHCRGAKWRNTEDSFPWLVKRVMASGFKTPWGVVAIAGIHILPIWLYAYETGFLSAVLELPQEIQYLGIAGLVFGRVVGGYAECFFIHDHVVNLLRHESSRESS